MEPLKRKPVCARRKHFGRNDELDVFELFNQHLCARSADPFTLRPHIPRYTPYMNLLQLCHKQGLPNAANNDEESDSSTLTQL